MQVIGASDMAHLTNILGNQRSWPLNLTIGIPRKDLCRLPKLSACVLIEVIWCAPSGARNNENAFQMQLELCCLNITLLT